MRQRRILLPKLVPDRSWGQALCFVVECHGFFTGKSRRSRRRDLRYACSWLVNPAPEF